MDLDLANLIIALFALVLSGIIVIRDYLLPAKLEPYVGDSLQIVSGDRNKIQLNLNLTNPSNKLSVLNRLEAYMKSPNGNRYHYVWNIFYKEEYTNNAMTALPDRLPTSVAILAKSSILQGIEFIADDRFSWTEGMYEFELLGWFNRGINNDPNTQKTVKFSLNKSDIDNLLAKYNGLPIRWPVKIIN